MNYENNVCPYDVGQLLAAKEVIEWVFSQENQIPNNVHSQTIFEEINNCIMNEVIRQLRIKILEDYATWELEMELASRKEEQP